MRELFNALTASLPVVATSPLALIAYVVTIAAWVIISLRVKRNKQLLSHIKDFPEKDRARVFRDLMGAVRLKEGLSPEQYLRSKIHQYYFYGFVILALVAVVIFVTSIFVADRGKVSVNVGLAPDADEVSGRPPPRPAPSAKAATLYEPLEGPVKFTDGDPESPSVQVTRGEYPPGERPAGGVLTYTYEQSGGVVEIKPNLPYLSLLEKGGPIDESMDYWWGFPKLAVKVVNNTEQTALVTDVRISVKSSLVNLAPVIRVLADAFSEGRLLILNEGWGPFPPMTVRFGLAPKGECDAGASGKTPHSTEVKGDENGNGWLDVKPFLPPELAKEEEVCVYGQIEYTTQSRGPHAVKFHAKVGMKEVGAGDLLAGAQRRSSASYCVFLDADKAGYTINISVSHEIKPGEADLFHVKVGANKSARYEMSFNFGTADGRQIGGNDVVLNTYVPNEGREGGERCEEQE